MVFEAHDRERQTLVGDDEGLAEPRELLRGAPGAWRIEALTVGGMPEQRDPAQRRAARKCSLRIAIEEGHVDSSAPVSLTV
jgi:hypothetical protein